MSAFMSVVYVCLICHFCNLSEGDVGELHAPAHFELLQPPAPTRQLPQRRVLQPCDAREIDRSNQLACPCNLNRRDADQLLVTSHDSYLSVTSRSSLQVRAI